MQAALDACASYLRNANASLRNEMTLLHLKRLYYEALCVLHASGVSSTQKYEAHFVLASFARQASKYMKHG